jgi:hypothetical protein
MNQNQNYSTNCPRCGGALIAAQKTLWEIGQDLNRRGTLALVTTLSLLAGALIVSNVAEAAGLSEGLVQIISMTLLLLAFVVGNIAFFSRRRWGRIQCLNCSARFREDQVIREPRAL